jgi:hypothetical protein
MSDAVNHPKHYNIGSIEVIDAIEAWNLGFHLGNAVKYIARAKHKGSPRQDLEKALWYLDRYIDTGRIDLGPLQRDITLQPEDVAADWNLSEPFALVIAACATRRGLVHAIRTLRAMLEIMQ